MNFDFVLYAMALGFTSVVYRLILAYEPILNWWFMFGLRFEKRFFYRPIWGCELCLAGQLAFWTYVVNWASTYFNGNGLFWRYIYFVIPNYKFKDFGVFWLISFICLAVLSAFALGKFVEHQKK